jgi:hypothetical protein
MVSIKKCAERFGISEQLAKILVNTVKDPTLNLS